MSTKAILSWSGGKDSAMALYEIQRTGNWKVEGLLTTIARDYDCVCMHGVRTALLEQQAAALGLFWDKIYLETNESQEAYDAKMQTYLAHCRERDIDAVIFGDLFLQDVRQYREQKLAQVGMQAVFPLWGQDTKALAQRFLQASFQAIVTCVDLSVLTPGFVGRRYDSAFLADLPPEADPCGERGEFHSFVYDGPLFQRPVRFQAGRTVVRENRFAYRDLIPSASQHEIERAAKCRYTPGHGVFPEAHTDSVLAGSEPASVARRLRRLQ